MWRSSRAARNAVILQRSLREKTPASDERSDHADNKQMRRIVDIEKPLHALPFPSFAVILLQYRQGQQRAHLEEPVDLVYKEEVHGGIDRRPYQHGEGLLFEIPAVQV